MTHDDHFIVLLLKYWWKLRATGKHLLVRVEDAVWGFDVVAVVRVDFQSLKDELNALNDEMIFHYVPLWSPYNRICSRSLYIHPRRLHSSAIHSPFSDSMSLSTACGMSHTILLSRPRKFTMWTASSTSSGWSMTNLK